MKAGLPSILADTPANPSGRETPLGLTVAVVVARLVPTMVAQPPDEIFDPKPAPSTTLVITGRTAAADTLKLNASSGSAATEAITVADPGAFPRTILVLACPAKSVVTDTGDTLASPDAK